MYKNYLYLFDDGYALNELKKNIGYSDFFQNISEKAFHHCYNTLRIHVNRVNLNDRYNKKIVTYGKKSKIDINNPVTLFAPYAITYDPDVFQKNPIGWPIKNIEIQNKGYEALQQGKPSCLTFYQNNFMRKSPYTSHCSAYVAFITQMVFGVQLSPLQIGDWCHAAAEQRDIMYYLSDWWDRVDSVQAQYAANEGKLAIAAYKFNDDDREGYEQNGHIAIILPITWKMARDLQNLPNYPKTPIIQDSNSFIEFIKINGPEISQSGGLNFSHTVCANGFSNYYEKPGITPIDKYIEFFVYKLYTQSMID